MNIVMMGHKTIPSRDGGIEVVVEEFSRRMSLLGNNVTILNIKPMNLEIYSKFIGFYFLPIIFIIKVILNLINSTSNTHLNLK